MDYATQRKNMVESQVRPSDVTDRRIIRAMLEIPREAFLPEAKRAVAYMDGAVAISGAGDRLRELMAPRTLAKLLQAAGIDEGDRVLIIGALTGYGAAVAARLGAHIVALESDPVLAAMASDNLKALAAGNAAAVAGPLAEGWLDGAPYDAIVIEGAVAAVPTNVLGQLKDEGRLVAIVGRGGAGRAVVWTRLDGAFGSAEVFDAAAAYLPGFEPVAEFAL